MWANVLLYPEHFGHCKSLCPINIIFLQAVPSFEVQQRDGGCVFSFLLGPAATTRGKVEGWLIPCCCCRLGKEAGYPYPPGPLTPWHQGREGRGWKCQLVPPTTTSFPCMMLSGSGGSAPHQPPLSLPQLGVSEHWWLPPERKWRNSFPFSPPTLYLQRTRSTASCCWGGREDYLSPWHHPEGSECCLLQWSGGSSWVMEWKLNFWFSPANTTVVDRCGLSIGI